MDLATSGRFQKDNINPWGLHGTFYPIAAVWSERKGVITFDPFEFVKIWRDIHAVWQHEHYSGALRLGCGRDTFAYTVWRVTGNWYSASQLRWMLEIGVALEWAIPNQGRNWYSCFLLRPIRYEHLL